MKKETKIYIGGTFDLLHAGHIRLFKRAKKYADIVIVALNTDEFHKRYKGDYPILKLYERKKMLKACKYVDKVIVNIGNEDSKPAIIKVQPDFILHGDDWKGKSLMKQMGLTEAFLQQQGIKMVYLPYTKGISTTEIKKRVCDKQ